MDSTDFGVDHIYRQGSATDPQVGGHQKNNRVDEQSGEGNKL